MTPMNFLTPGETLNVGGLQVTATDLAKARQQLAADGPWNAGFYDWDGLSPAEQQQSVLAAAGWLRALAGLLAAGPDPTDRLAVAENMARHLNHPMIDQLRRAAADTSPNWDVTATIYPPSAVDLVALIDYLRGAPEQAPA